jgi:hypothetical protein
MSEYTLREARKIETRINEFLNKQPTLSHVIHYTEEFPHDWVTQSVCLTDFSINDHIEALSIKHTIRASIQEVNSTTTINDLIGKRKHLIDLSKIWQAVLETYNSQDFPVSRNIVENKINQMLKSIDNGNEYASTSHNFTTISEIQYQDAQKQVLKIRHEIEDIDIKLGEQNKINTIKLTDEQQEWLSIQNIL